MNIYHQQRIITIGFFILLVFGGPILLSFFTDKEGTIKVLHQQGFTHINVQGRAWFSCSKDDVYQTSFTAISPTGETVEGAVCSGWFKNKTVRFN